MLTTIKRLVGCVMSVFCAIFEFVDVITMGVVELEPSCCWIWLRFIVFTSCWDWAVGVGCCCAVCSVFCATGWVDCCCCCWGCCGCDCVCWLPEANSRKRSIGTDWLPFTCRHWAIAFLLIIIWFIIRNPNQNSNEYEKKKKIYPEERHQRGRGRILFDLYFFYKRLGIDAVVLYRQPQNNNRLSHFNISYVCTLRPLTSKSWMSERTSGYLSGTEFLARFSRVCRKLRKYLSRSMGVVGLDGVAVPPPNEAIPVPVWFVAAAGWPDRRPAFAFMPDVGVTFDGLIMLLVLLEGGVGVSVRLVMLESELAAAELVELVEEEASSLSVDWLMCTCGDEATCCCCCCTPIDNTLVDCSAGLVAATKPPCCSCCWCCGLIIMFEFVLALLVELFKAFDVCELVMRTKFWPWFWQCCCCCCCWIV